MKLLTTPEIKRRYNATLARLGLPPLIEIASAAPPDYTPPSESLSQSSLDSPKHSEPS